MRYYTLSFGYEGPKYNIPSDEITEADHTLVAAITDVMTSLKTRGFDVRSQYAWPDGSLYLWLRVKEGSLGHVACAIELALSGLKGVRLIGVSEVNPKERFTSGKTVVDEFAEVA